MNYWRPDDWEDILKKVDWRPLAGKQTSTFEAGADTIMEVLINKNSTRETPFGWMVFIPKSLGDL